MTRRWLVLAGGWMAVALAGCAGPSRNTLFQTSTIDALLAGVYDGDLSLRELRRHGNFGIGTFDDLDGEMVLLDGQFHQVRADGRVYSPDLDGETPFAAVCRFQPERQVAVPSGLDMDGVEQLLDREAAGQNWFAAIRMDGHFKMVRTRSVPAQSRPYPLLKDVAASQPVFTCKDIPGTIVGFRCPPYVVGVNVSGWHFHFISRDRSFGGHLLGFEVVTGMAQVDMLDRLVMQLPATKDFAGVDLSRDRQAELEGVEKEKK